MAAVSQDYPPLLFTLPSEQPAEFRTPRSIHSPLRDASGSISTARRSVTPPGSVHTDTTPPRPPPIMRLQDTLMSGAQCAGWHSCVGLAIGKHKHLLIPRSCYHTGRCTCALDDAR
eukprot:GHRQ01015368.1.p1 GENE.GHRQ01015368.1~~GHRQ01015368.1.p1  ORF type:complete len:116 (+),score=17.91 GHRQ01015368.1:469-816(+)